MDNLLFIHNQSANKHDKYIKYKTKYLQLKNNFEYLDHNKITGGTKKKIKKSHKNNIISNRKMSQNNLINSTNSTNSIDFNSNSDYVEHLSEPWFSLISLGLKTVEGRRNKGKFADMKIGSVVKWFNNDFGPRYIYTKITDKIVYDTFENYLNSEGLEKCLPGIKTINQGLSVYFKYYTKEDEKKFGVVAIKFELVYLD